MGLPAWQSVCLQFDPRATRGHLMIGKDSRVKIKTERSVYPRPRSFSQAYKYKTFFTHRISFAYRVRFQSDSTLEYTKEESDNEAAIVHAVICPVTPLFQASSISLRDDLSCILNYFCLLLQQTNVAATFLWKRLLTLDARKGLTPKKLRAKTAKFAKATVKAQMASFKINRTINIFTVCLQRFGVWADWDHPYLTLDPEYEAAHIKVFGQMVFKGFIYRDRKPVHWSPSSRNALAEAELECQLFNMITRYAKRLAIQTSSCFAKGVMVHITVTVSILHTRMSAEDVVPETYKM
ncbi:isoleucine--tRNA ligase, chloroplastic/mitochondrial [Tanacetum coccineum]